MDIESQLADVSRKAFEFNESLKEVLFKWILIETGGEVASGMIEDFFGHYMMHKQGYHKQFVNFFDHFISSNCTTTEDGIYYERATDLSEVLRACVNSYTESKWPKFDYYSSEYRHLRLQVFLKHGEVCAKCGKVPCLGVSLTVDHIKPVSKYPEMALEFDNLQVLCWECNQKKSNLHTMDYRKK